MNPIDPASITLAGMLVAGLATSLHCAGMCGLLTCGLGIAGHGSQVASIGVYHFCRLVGYFVAGSLAGGLGQILGVGSLFAGLYWLPWLLIIFLVVIASGGDRRTRCHSWSRKGGSSDSCENPGHSSSGPVCRGRVQHPVAPLWTALCCARHRALPPAVG